MSAKRFVITIVVTTLVLAGAAVWHYAALGLTLSHYDAKAHLVVARRIFDSLTPGWRQVGAVWLPLPHVLNALPVQVDVFYRTGASGVAISVVAFALAVGVMASLVLRMTGSQTAALAAAAVLATDPNLLYLQATPMTEPLLLGLSVLGVAWLHRWVVSGAHESTAPAGLALAAACLTRYEAWPVTAAALGIAALCRWRLGDPLPVAVRRTARVAIYPVLAILGFLVLSRVTIGEWFVTGGFYVAENEAHGRPLAAALQVWRGLRELVGLGTLLGGLAGALLLIGAALTRRARTPLLLALSLAAMAALPWYAFVSGHPFRVRYMVVLTAVLAACTGIGIGLLPRRLRAWAAVAAVAVTLMETPPFDPRSPLVAEAQWDRPNSIARREVTRCLADGFVRPDHKVLVSMGSLAHYMQELSLAGFGIRDYIHEGIEDLWDDALVSPRRHVEWILFEEQAEGGDVLTALRREQPDFVAGFTRACSAGGVALYRRNDEPERAD